jgi:hypothetical protein
MIDPKPKVKLVGEDGNAYFILGRCMKAMRNAKAPAGEWETFHKEATSGDYDHLLRTVMEWFDCDSEDDEEEE